MEACKRCHLIRLVPKGASRTILQLIELGYGSKGLVLVLLGQTARSMAMITAASNFNHDVQFVKREKHELVTKRIYQYSRHPSYAAFFYWAVGTQILLGNPISAVGFAIILYRFFSTRIKCKLKNLGCATPLTWT